MLHALDAIPWIIVIGIIPYMLPVLMPSGRMLAGCILVIGGVIAYLWIGHMIAVQSPNYKERVGDAIGLAFFTIASTTFATGCVVRIVCLISSAAGGSFGRTFAISVAGFSVPIAIFVVPSLWHAWLLRPPP
jgi:hypothetical protein